MKRFSVAIGDKVAYSVDFLRNTGQSHTELSHARGVVTAVESIGDSLQLAVIDWSNEETPARVNVQNLAIVGANTRFCAC